MLNPIASHEADAGLSPFPPLHSETRPTVGTAAAAYYLNRRPQTLRIWAMNGGVGSVQCVRINGRLAWSVAGIRLALGVAR